MTAKQNIKTPCEAASRITCLSVSGIGGWFQLIKRLKILEWEIDTFGGSGVSNIKRDEKTLFLLLLSLAQDPSGATEYWQEQHRFDASLCLCCFCGISAGAHPFSPLASFYLLEFQYNWRLETTKSQYKIVSVGNDALVAENNSKRL